MKRQGNENILKCEKEGEGDGQKNRKIKRCREPEKSRRNKKTKKN